MNNLILSPLACGAQEGNPLNSNYEVYLLKYNLKQELNKQLEKYIAILKHDVKTPVLAQIRAVEHILAQYCDKLPETQKDLLSTILESCNEQHNIINNLIKTMKYKQQEFLLNESCFDLIDVLKSGIKNFKEELLNKGLHVNLNLTSERADLKADYHKISDALHKILKNIFSRAAKHSDVNITVKKEGIHLGLIIVISSERSNNSCGFQYTADKEVFIDAENYNSVGYELEFQVASDIINVHNGSLKAVQEGNSYLVEIKLPLKKED